MKGGNSSDLPKKEGNSIFEVKSQFLQNQLIQWDQLFTLVR